MKKAQWKEPAVGRQFGVRSELQQIQSLKNHIMILEERNELLKFSYETLRKSSEAEREENNKLRTAQLRYKWLRANGVVLEHEGEFKHLKGEDMDKFFECMAQPLFADVFTQAIAASLRHTKHHVSTGLLTGKSIYKMWMDEVTEAKNGSNA